MSRPGARKHFGQHFLHDGNIIRKLIAAVGPAASDHFVEIGPGRGALTRPLLERVARLDAVEIDRDLARDLPALLGNDRLRVHCADALRFDFTALASPGERLRLAANLPYNISTPLLFHLLDQRGIFSDMHVMLQKEVGDRMVAPPGTKTYGRLTVALAARCRVERLFLIRPGSFQPPPKVDSVFLRVVPLASDAPVVRSFEVLDAVVTRAFGMRRKRLANALRDVAGEDRIRAAGIDPDLRPEQVTPHQFIALANQLALAGAVPAVGD